MKPGFHDDEQVCLVLRRRASLAVQAVKVSSGTEHVILVTRIADLQQNLLSRLTRLSGCTQQQEYCSLPACMSENKQRTHKKTPAASSSRKTGSREVEVTWFRFLVMSARDGREPLAGVREVSGVMCVLCEWVWSWTKSGTGQQEEGGHRQRGSPAARASGDHHHKESTDGGEREQQSVSSLPNNGLEPGPGLDGENGGDDPGLRTGRGVK